MNGKGKYFIISGIAACLSLLLIITSVYGANITIGGDYTDIGTIIFVSPKPGDSATANGTALLNTLNGITDASETNPYLIKLGPGIYDLGTCDTSGTPPFPCVVHMKPYVSIEGSGEKATKITAAVSSAVNTPPTAGTVMGADNAELRSLSVESTGTGTYTVAILNVDSSPSMLHVKATGLGLTNSFGVWNSGAAPLMTNVTAEASGGSNVNRAINNTVSSAPVMTNVTATASGGSTSAGVTINSSTPTMTNVTATASGGSVNNYGIVTTNNALPVMINVTATASGTISFGLYSTNYSSATTILIDRSTFEGGTNSILNTTNLTLLIGASKLVGSDVNSAGVYNCIGVYKYIGGVFSAVANAATCQ